MAHTYHFSNILTLTPPAKVLVFCKCITCKPTFFTTRAYYSLSMNVCDSDMNIE